MGSWGKRLPSKMFEEQILSLIHLIEKVYTCHEWNTVAKLTLISTFPKAPQLMFRLDPNAGMKLLRQSNSMALSTNYNYRK